MNNTITFSTMHMTNTNCKAYNQAFTAMRKRNPQFRFCSVDKQSGNKLLLISGMNLSNKLIDLAHKRLAYERHHKLCSSYIFVSSIMDKPTKLTDDELNDLVLARADKIAQETINMSDLNRHKDFVTWRAQAITVADETDQTWLAELLRHNSTLSTALDIMSAQISDSNFDMYNAGTEVAVEKDHTWTADADTDFATKGETFVHTEERVKYMYTVDEVMNTIRNWTQIQYYIMVDCTPDYIEIEDESVIDSSVAVEWL